MTRSRCIGLILLVMVGNWSLACKHKPAYSNVQRNEGEKTRDDVARQQPADGSAEPNPANGGQPPPPMPEPQIPLPQAQGEAAAAAKSTEIKPPPFFDPSTGEFKDLPRYPRAMRTYAQVGPVNGIEAGMFMLETVASYERIAAFYDDAIKKNGWTVVSSTRDTEYYRWELRKGKVSEALIEVKSDGKSTRKNILLSRADRPEGK